MRVHFIFTIALVSHNLHSVITCSRCRDLHVIFDSPVIKLLEGEAVKRERVILEVIIEVTVQSSEETMSSGPARRTDITIQCIACHGRSTRARVKA